MSTTGRVAAIIAAAGQGRRLGRATPKQWLPLAGRTMVQRSVDAFDACHLVDEIVVVVGSDAAVPALAARKPLRIVRGGERRQDSVANGFEATGEGAAIIVIHDAARPFVTTALIERTIAAAREAGAAVAALAARDTVKQVEGGSRDVARTLDRESIFLAQTPQAFRRDVLRDAITRGREVSAASPLAHATDEAMLAERAGHAVRIVLGEVANMKITTEEDFALAEAMLDRAGAAGPGDVRTGVGYDLHRLVEGRPLVLGGITIPFDRGLLGHSDADAICHAITDAVLGAAGAGDIGGHFPDTDPRWKGASSLELLREVVAKVRDRGFLILNVDAVVVAEHPKLTPHVAAIRESLAGALGIAPNRVSVKGKTNEGVGELGRGEALAVHAVATLRKS